MAVLWHRECDGDRYEIRSHGASIRLYSNGVLHSQWNPDRPLRGSLWELLYIPVCFRPPASVRRILVLGVGGGTVIRLLQRLLPGASITAVDINPVHLEVCRDWFGVERVELICDDAVNFVEAYRGPDFDLIIDDLFGHSDGIPSRAIPVTPTWCKALGGILAPAGLMVTNFASRKEFLNCGWRKAPDVTADFAARWSLQLPQYENTIGVFSREELNRQFFTQNLAPPWSPSAFDLELRKG
ncbi:spermidine synthase [Biformimicrobium ophioploci]|uniref:Methyltransferase domain-containing protein n=1 Tax=Biformimicrobium ophioploci TaxID=3036711 RepID=A0ABQ6M2Y9_9GAMM|nr:methyltransferase domain-containing protein [Microbulbifer sp. NKW57]GMG88721.1 hypothetical protein MNKW57_30420 [Microbulbifer sp. NKW57]